MAGPFDEAPDADFLFEVYASTRSDVRSFWPDASYAEQFLRLQHRFQLASYARDYPSAERELLYCRGERAGYLCCDRTGAAMTLIDIALLPRFRGRGLGTQAIRRLQADARAKSRALRLSVRPDNPARLLYQRLGFVVTRASEVNLVMIWHPEQTLPLKRAENRMIGQSG